jgi:tetratricopeptide (TPR) repeat protein
MRTPAPHFSARIHEVTGGNPFFILQALRALQEQGLLKRDGQGVWHTPWDAPETDYRDLPLPAGLPGALDARLRGLGPQERASPAALGQSSAPAARSGIADETADRPTADRGREIGATIAPVPGLQSPRSRYPDLSTSRSSEWPSVVGQLLKRQFLVEDGAGFRFAHETLRVLIYNDLDEATRRDLHMRAATALEREHFERVEALAQHLYQAGAWGKSLPYLIEAGDRARAACAWQDALGCYDQALEAAARAGADLRTRCDIQLRRAAVATSLGNYPTAIGAYEAVLRLTDQDDRARGPRRDAHVQALNGLSSIPNL